MRETVSRVRIPPLPPSASVQAQRFRRISLKQGTPLDEKITYWLKGQDVQNFGDFLTEVLRRDVVLKPRIDADIFRLVGSVISEGVIWADLESIRAKGLRQDNNEIIAYWGCGMRDDTAIPSGILPHCRFFGVRGPLTRDLLKLPRDTVLGDPALLFPLIYRKRRRWRRGPAICVAHFHDKISEAELLKMTGADEAVSIHIPNDVNEIFRLVDRIASASFVLTGALHAAVIACAYNVPFAYLDTGYIDLPFKWKDFSASISIPAIFVKNLEEGRRVYDDVRSKIKKPRLLPLLNICPFVTRGFLSVRAVIHDIENSISSLFRALQMNWR